jgi:hypothetical protein
MLTTARNFTKDVQTVARGPPGRLGDRDGTAEILDRGLADQHAPDDAQRHDAHLDGLGHGPIERLDGTVADLDAVVVHQTVRNQHAGPDPTDGFPLDLRGSRP